MLVLNNWTQTYFIYPNKHPCSNKALSFFPENDRTLSGVPILQNLTNKTVRYWNFMRCGISNYQLILVTIALT